MVASYSMRAMSAANLSHVLDRIESLAPKIANRLQRANDLVETLSAFQATLKRLKLEDSPLSSNASTVHQGLGPGCDLSVHQDPMESVPSSPIVSIG